MPQTFDPGQFLLDLEENITKLPSDIEDINHTCEEFVKTFNTTLDHHAPYHFASRNEQDTFQKP